MESENSSFVHLHVHTGYSLLDGAIQIDRLIDRAIEFGMDSVAITDHGNMFGVMEFYSICNQKGIKPIIGCEFYVTQHPLDYRGKDTGKPNHLVLLAKNQAGYQNLCKLNTIAHLEGYYYRPRVTKAAIHQNSEGLIALSACIQGEIPQLILKNKMEEARNAACYYQKIFGDGGFYLEVQNNGLSDQDKVNQALKVMGEELGIPLVATNDCHYLNPEDAYAHEVLLCIQTGKKMSDPNRFRFGTDKLYFKSQQTMVEDFVDFPGAVENTREIADQCNLDIDCSTYHFPRFCVEEEGSDTQRLKEKAESGFANRWEEITIRNPAADKDIYRVRLNYELQMIEEMEFSGYFCIVADFVDYARSHNIPVGPGRGSAVGSMVAYCLGITGLDPLEHGLIFERFLNLARKSMPDIDVDFCVNGREVVYQYVVNRYGGPEKVCKMITFGKLKAKSVIRDVGRALDIPLVEINSIAGMIPDEQDITLDQSLEDEPKLAELVKSKPNISDLFNICRSLEGLPRHSSTHASAVVVSDRPLVEYLPLSHGKDKEPLTQFDMEGVEKIGLVKFDFLGLRNLAIMDYALKTIRDREKTPPDISNLDLTDTQTYQLLASGDTVGVFQLEGKGMRDLLVHLKPDSFADIVALVALYRPGPLESGMVDDFVDCKHGRKPVHYLVPELEPILRETYGVIVYQEQVMRIAVDLAGYTMSEADDLRKAIGKKKPEILVKQRELFTQGAVRKGIQEDKAKQLFDLIEKFGGYGFNKSHSAAYALVAFQNTYLKAHFELEYLIACLNVDNEQTADTEKYISECKRRGIKFLPPDINESQADFSIWNGMIRFGLGSLKYMGEKTVNSILAARGDHGFDSLLDFCNRVDSAFINRKNIQVLIASGAFDCTGVNRSQMMASVDGTMKYAAKKKENKPALKPSENHIPEWTPARIVQEEKNLSGYYISYGPLEIYQRLLKNLNAITVQKLLSIDRTRIEFRIGGIITRKNEITKNRRKPMAFIEIQDDFGSIDVTVFHDIFQKSQSILKEGEVVLIGGLTKRYKGGISYIAKTIKTLEEVDRIQYRGIILRIPKDLPFDSIRNGLITSLREHSGKCRVLFHVEDNHQSQTVVPLTDDYSVYLDRDLLLELSSILGKDNIRIVPRFR